MAMTFQQLMKQDAQLVLVNDAEFAESITYTPKAPPSTAVVRNAVVDRTQLEVMLTEDGESDLRTAKITIINDATLGVVAPAKRDAVLLDGVTWFVSALDPEPTMGTHTLTITTRELVEIGPANPIGG